MANNEIQLMSNVKIITSGNRPTTANLLPGQAAFGKISDDNKYHLFGNTGEGGGAGKVVDIVVDTIDSTVNPPTLENVLTNGNTSTTDIIIADGNIYFANLKTDGLIIKNTQTGSEANYKSNMIKLSDGTKDIFNISQTGVLDNTDNPLLTSNPSQTYTEANKAKFRSILDVLSSSETKALISGVYKVKGSVASFNALVTNESYTPEIGDVWNIEAAGGQDSHGQNIKAGDNIVFVGPDKATDWDILAGVIDLSGYYTKTDVDKIKENLQSEVEAAQAAADAAQATANTAKSTADAAQTIANAAQTTANAAKTAVDAISADYVKESEFDTKAETAFDGFVTSKHVVTDENYVHTDNNYTSEAKAKVDKLDFSGDGSKVITDDGSAKTLKFSIVSL